MSDGQEYSNERLSKDPTGLMMSTVKFWTAHEESKKKGQRVSAARSQERRLAVETGRKITAQCPTWLKLDKATNQFEVLEDRAEIVRRIFKEAIAGKGQKSIAAGLNMDGVPTFGRTKARAKHWQKSFVHKILMSPSVIGEHTPYRWDRDEETRKVTKVPTTTIKDYFPAVVSIEDWTEVRALDDRANRKAQRGTKAGEVRNLFGGLARCGLCGRAATMVYNGTPPRQYLACTGKREGMGCTFKSIKYANVERAFLVHYEEALNYSVKDDDGQAAANQLEVLDGVLGDTREAIHNIVEAMAQGKRTPALAEKLHELETQKAAMEAERAEVEKAWVVSAPLVVEKRVETLRQALKAPEGMDRAKVNALLRQVFKSITVDRKNGQLVFQWQAGGETSLTVAWPQED
jgi:hypothetical protein